VPPRSIDHSSWSRTSCTDDFRPNPSLTARNSSNNGGLDLHESIFRSRQSPQSGSTMSVGAPSFLPKPRHGLPSDGVLRTRAPNPLFRSILLTNARLRKTHCVIQTQFMSRTVSFWREFPKAVLAAYLWPEGLVAFLACLLLTSNWIQTATLGGRASETL